MISSPSPWRVSFDGDDRYMWQCLLYFIGLGLAPQPLPLADPPGPPPALERPQTGSSSSTDTNTSPSLAAAQGEGSDVQQQQQQRSANFPGWVRRATERKPMLQADNVDLLFRLRSGGGGGLEEGVGGAARQRREPSPRMPAGASAGTVFSRGGGRKGSPPGGGEVGAGTKGAALGGEAEPGAPVKDNAFLEFVAPGKVEIRHEELDGEEAVGEGQVLVQAICSSISSGTELKVCKNGRVVEGRMKQPAGDSGGVVRRALDCRALCAARLCV